MVQPLWMASTSNLSCRIRILPHVSQIGGIRILSRSMMLCLTGSRRSREWISREEWIRVCRELGFVGEVYISDDPSVQMRLDR